MMTGGVQYCVYAQSVYLCVLAIGESRSSDKRGMISNHSVAKFPITKRIIGNKCIYSAPSTKTR